jgi:hypothetical protein
MFSITAEKFLKARTSQNVGMTKLFMTIVDSATDSTMIMAVAAENPPMNTKSASSGWP